MLTYSDLRPLTGDLPPIVLLSSVDYGGAGIAVRNLYEGLLAAGARVQMLVLDSAHAGGGVNVAKVNGKSAHILNTAFTASALRRYPCRPVGYEMFSIAKSPVDIADFDLVKKAGLFHLHWAPGLVGFPAVNNALSGKAAVLTLHDMNYFTGGCHYTAGCGKYKKDGCENCPQLGPANGGGDLAAENFAAKRAGYADLNMTVVTPSRWLGGCARESLLLGRFPQITIPYGIDTDVFAPTPKENARAVFNLPLGRKIILFGANGVERRNKGYHILLEALKCLREKYPKELPFLLVFGTLPSGEALPEGYDCQFPGFIQDKATLAAAYSVADVFVSPSFQEAFGLVTAEAQLCSTPGIGFYGTGAEDIIQDGITGFLAKHPGLPLANGAIPDKDDAYRTFSQESVEDLTEKIKRILELPPDEYEAMRRACREHAAAEYSPVLQTERYLRLYRKILGLPEK